MREVHTPKAQSDSSLCTRCYTAQTLLNVSGIRFINPVPQSTRAVAAQRLTTVYKSSWQVFRLVSLVSNLPITDVTVVVRVRKRG
jgi:hypothetical protein